TIEFEGLYNRRDPKDENFYRIVGSPQHGEGRKHRVNSERSALFSAVCDLRGVSAPLEAHVHKNFAPLTLGCGTAAKFERQHFSPYRLIFSALFLLVRGSYIFPEAHAAVSFAQQSNGLDNVSPLDGSSQASGTATTDPDSPVAGEQESGDEASWRMTGHDISNSRSQPSESTIGSRNVARLAPKWILTTFGDVSATPAVVTDDESDRQVVYFPDWGGKLWKVDAETRGVLWMRSVSDYNGVSGSVSRTTPVVGGRMLYVGDLNGNMMAIDPATGDLRWITRLDSNPAVIVTASPIIRGNRLYADVSSNESAYARTHPGYTCCKF